MPSTRKEKTMKKGIGWRLMGTFLAASLSWIGCVSAVPAAAQVTLTVYNPTGAVEVKQIFAPRLADLNGKTICELSNDGWEASRTFPAIRQLLQRQFPTVKFVPYTEFPHGHGSAGGGTYAMDDDRIVDMVKKKGCQAVITGNAG
jgi:hypothetical protein